MSEEAEQPEGEEEEQKGGGKKKLIIIIVAALVVLGGGGGAAAFFLGLFGGEEVQAEANNDADDEDGAAEGEADGEQSPDEELAEGGAEGDGSGDGEGPVVFVAMPDVLVNLNSSGNRMRFLKLKASLETANPEVATKVEALMPRIMDSFQVYLRALTIDEVRGSTGLAQLKEELMVRVNHAVHPARVDDILVKEMLVQ